jgi:D-alanine-D-alanine ligase
VKVLIIYNEPALAGDHPDAASEAGVLESVEAVTTSLAAHVHRCFALGLGPSIDEAIASILDLEHYDVVINLFEGFSGVGRGEAVIAGLVELRGFAMTGSPAECLDLVRHKPRTKWLLSGAGISTPEFLLIPPKCGVDRAKTDSLLGEGPLIVKPAHEDASLGISLASVVDNQNELETQLNEVHERYGAALVERFISGREFNVSVLALPEPQALPLAEIEFGEAFPPDRRLVTYDAKWAVDSDQCTQSVVRCPAEVDPVLATEIRRVALAAFRATGCRDYARVDMRVSDAGEVYVLEVNGNPDISPTAGFAKALEAAGIEYDSFIHRMVKNAYARRCPV